MVKERKVILITGCSSGIGLETARRFAIDGWRVIAGVRDMQNMKEAAELDFENLEVVQLDVTKDEDVKKIVQLIKDRYKRLDVVVNNAGYGLLGPVEVASIEETKQQFEVNVYGMLRVTKAVIPIMRTTGGGKIVNISSVVGVIPFPLYGIYSASKFAMETISEVLNYELAPDKIGVVVVEPGTFWTKFWENRLLPKALEGSRYEEWVNSFFYRLHHSDIASLRSVLYRRMKPGRVADLIYRIAELEKPKLRYRIGVDANLYYWAHRFLPEFVWRRILRKVYKW